MRSGLSLSEQELIIRVNAADPAFVEVDVTFPKYRRQLERWGFKPILTDSFGGARAASVTRNAGGATPPRARSTAD